MAVQGSPEGGDHLEQQQQEAPVLLPDLPDPAIKVCLMHTCYLTAITVKARILAENLGGIKGQMGLTHARHQGSKLLLSRRPEQRLPSDPPDL
jgi:hypothetical protein